MNWKNDLKNNEYEQYPDLSPNEYYLMLQLKSKESFDLNKVSDFLCMTKPDVISTIMKLVIRGRIEKDKIPVDIQLI